MTTRTIVTLPGDGIGRVVLEQALRVLEAAGFDAEYTEGDIGWEFWRSEGNPLPQRTLDLLEKHKVGLFGALSRNWPRNSRPKTSSMPVRSWVCASILASTSACAPANPIPGIPGISSEGELPERLKSRWSTWPSSVRIPKDFMAASNGPTPRSRSTTP